MNKLILFIAAFTIILMESGAIAEDKPCAILVRSEKGAQIIPLQGNVVSQPASEAPLGCGSMVSTHQGVLWFKYLTQTTFKLSQDTFFELSKNSEQERGDEFHLYRGQILISSPPLDKVLVITTPNSRVEFKGGVAWIEYHQEKKMTTVASFNRSFEFKNKFAAASQTIHVGEMSHLSVAEARVLPTQPEVMSVSTVQESLTGFKLEADETKEMVNVVQNVFETRAKSFTTDLDNWHEEEKPQQVERKIASKPKNVVDVVDPKEAELSMALMKQHLFGDKEDLKILNAGDRKPASAQKIKDVEYERQKLKEKKEAGKAIKDIANLKEKDE